MSYRREVPPPTYEQDWMEREVQQIERSFSLPQLPERNRAVEKPRTGMLVFADGTNWDPGSGRGVYVFDGTVWVKL